MQIVDRGNKHELELFAETPEEIKLLKDMWDNGIFRQALDAGHGDDFAALIITPRLLDDQEFQISKPEWPLAPDAIPRALIHNNPKVRAVALMQMIYELFRRLSAIETKLNIK